MSIECYFSRRLSLFTCTVRLDVDVMVNRDYEVIGLLVGLGMVCDSCYLQLPSLFI